MSAPFQVAAEYMVLSKEMRQEHLELSESCIEIGGGSKDFRGLLAHFLRTMILTRKDGVNLCHACNNSKCSNPRHLYWGTAKENRDDLFQTGFRMPKRGYPMSDEHKKKVGLANSIALKGKKKSEDHCKAVSEAIKKRYEDPVVLEKQRDIMNKARNLRLDSSVGRAGV